MKTEITNAAADATRNAGAKLTDEQFAALLCANSELPRAISTADQAAQADLVGLRASVHSYRTETMQWAERRSAGQPSLALLAARNERWAALPQWSLALVALVTIAGGVAHFSNNDSAADTSPVAVTVTPAAARPATPVDIEADNRLLSSINAALNSHSASVAVDALDLRTSDDKTVRSSATGVTE